MSKSDQMPSPIRRFSLPAQFGGSNDSSAKDLSAPADEDERRNIVKKVAGYHQFRAVRKAQASVICVMKNRGTGFQPVKRIYGP